MSAWRNLHSDKRLDTFPYICAWVSVAQFNGSVSAMPAAVSLEFGALRIRARRIHCSTLGG
jgi:hypothetical protein